MRAKLQALMSAALLLVLAACAASEPPAPVTLASAAESLAAQGSQMFQRGCLPAAGNYFSQALSAARLVDDVPAMARANNNLAAVALAAGDLDAAGAWLSRAEHLSKSAPSAALASLILGNLGSLAYERGRLAEAERLWREALAAAEADPARTALVLHLTNLAMLARQAGRLEVAAELLKRAAAAGGEARAGFWLQTGLLARAAGDLDRAERDLASALYLDKRAAYPAGIAGDLASLGALNAARGRVDQGLGLMDRSIRLWAELGRADKAAKVLKQMQMTAEAAGKKCEAKAYDRLLIKARQGPSPLLCR